MRNILTNVLKTKGLGGQQPWKQYYQGIKPSNPLGGNIRRMGNKVKAVVPASVGKNMQFSYMENNLANFNPQQFLGYVEDYAFGSRRGRSSRYYGGYGNRSMTPYDLEAQRRKEARQNAEDIRANYREAKGTLRDTRSTYRAGLETVREAKNIWKLIKKEQ